MAEEILNKQALAPLTVAQERAMWLEPPADGTDAPATGGIVRLVVIAFAIAFAIWHLLTNTIIAEPVRLQNAIHFAGFAFLAAVILPAFPNWRNRRASIAVDVTYGLLVAGAALWVALGESSLYERSLGVTGQSWQFRPIDWAAGFLLIFACLDLSRRVSGWVIPILIILSLAYILGLGSMLPGVFRSASLSVTDVMFRTLYNDEGMFGILATISSVNITLFMIFGGFLVASGASNFVIELSKVVAGKIRGGAAFVAVISSALTGTISGSAIANTASTGIITIPLMKANGFRGKFAGGVEAAASTGGQLMPPIMGAGAFVMASYTSIPYATIVAVSIMPAILYFLSVAFIVRIEAMKHNVGSGVDLTVDRSKLVSGALVFVVPLGSMITMLVSGVTPAYAAAWSIGVLIGVSWLTSIASRIVPGKLAPVDMGPGTIAQALTIGIRTSIMTGILLVAIGIMNNAIVTSGVGNGFSLMIAQWSQGNLVLAIALIAIASLVLGMGLPVTAAYIILAVLTAPALAGLMADAQIVAQLVTGISDPTVAALFALVDSPLAAQVATGMTLAEAQSLMGAVPFELALSMRPLLVDQALLTTYLLTAHLIIFWLSQDSNVTPPVCLAAFAAAGIAKAPPMATGFQAWKIAKGLYIVPLLFAYTPLISGDFLQIMQIGFFALFGIYATNALIQVYAEGPLNFLSAPLLVVGAVGAYWPLAITYNVAGAACVVLAIWLSRRKRGTQAADPSVVPA
ncbi:MAG: TRAP transporter fused permease subunit [Pseudomonadota bacterium]